MIQLTHFDGSQFFVNADFIEFVESTPDTVLCLIDHKKLLVRESAEEVIARIFDVQARARASLPARFLSLADRLHTHDYPLAPEEGSSDRLEQTEG